MNERPRGRPARDSQGRPQVVQRGTEKRPWNDAYHELLNEPNWTSFLAKIIDWLDARSSAKAVEK